MKASRQQEAKQNGNHWQPDLKKMDTRTRLHAWSSALGMPSSQLRRSTTVNPL